MQADVTRYIGVHVLDTDGEPVGTIDQVFVDGSSGAPAWLRIRTKRFGARDRFVPLAGSQHSERGLAVPYRKQTIKNGPDIEANGSLSAEQVEELRRYYGMWSGDVVPGQAYVQGGGRNLDDSDSSDEGMRIIQPAASLPGNGGAPAPADGRPSYDQPLVAGRLPGSAGELRISAEEHVVVEREPITDRERAEGVHIGELDDNEHEFIVHEERVVVRKETVPVERVRVRVRRLDEPSGRGGPERRSGTDHTDGEPGLGSHGDG